MRRGQDLETLVDRTMRFIYMQLVECGATRPVVSAFIRGTKVSVPRRLIYGTFSIWSSKVERK